MASQIARLFRCGWHTCSQVLAPITRQSCYTSQALPSASLRCFSAAAFQRPPVMSGQGPHTTVTTANHRPLLQPSTLPQHATQVRTKIYYNRNSGGPRPVKAAMYRFFRLHNGMWIRVQAKRSRKKWAKSPSHHERLQRHLLCNRQQCQMLDKMATEYYKKPKFYVDDPYEPYHKFSNLPLFRYQKPRYFP